MYFNSYIFIFLFVPVTLLGYYILNHYKKYRPALCWVVFASLVFYSWADLPLFFLISASVAGNHLMSFLMKKTGRKKLFGIIGIIYDLGLLFYFKYYDFFISNVNAVFHADWALKHIALPLGISFYTFQQISYMADRMTDKADHYGLLDYMSFVTFFPQLVAGPIVKHSDLVPQFLDDKKKAFNWTYFSKGVTLFVLGLSKKVLIADTLSMYADHGFDNVGLLDSPAALAVMLAYTFQLYYDFSGYCDMAIGLGWMFNVDLPLNFNLPYRSKSIREFWRRWHITLSSFFREYVYFPLGGSRKGKFRKELNTFIIFMLSGLWHGAAWNFVIWGCFHGIMLVFEDIFEKPLKKMEESKVLAGIKWFFTFVLINLSWVLFRVNSLADLPVYFKKLFSFKSDGYLLTTALKMDNALLYIPDILVKKIGGEGMHNALYLSFMGMCLLIAALPGLGKSAYERAGALKYKRSSMVILSLLFVASVLSLSKVIVFLYSNF